MPILANHAGLLRTFVAVGLIQWVASCSARIEESNTPELPPATGGTAGTGIGVGGTTGVGGSTGVGSSTGMGGSIGLGGMPIIVPVAGSSSSGGPGTGEVCQAETREGRRIPTDMYFLVDSSGSMAEEVPGGAKWDLVSGALVSFLSDPRNADMGVGIGYFPNAVQTCTAGQPDCLCIPIINWCIPLAGGSCVVDDYSTPAVPLALPPAPLAVVTDIGAHQLSGGTPTRPAVEGALQYLAQWSEQHPDRKTLLVLATDGDPTGCASNTPADVATLAAAALAGPHAIRTFVIGVGQSLTSLNAIAQAGGSGQAFLVDTGGDVAASFADALDKIRGASASCDFLIPSVGTDGETVDPTKVNVRYSPDGSAPILLPQVDSSDPANCGDRGGWYYDVPSNPKTIKLCEATCQAIGDGSIQVEFGCNTIVDPPR
jgi:hypothetical protein